MQRVVEVEQPGAFDMSAIVRDFAIPDRSSRPFIGNGAALFAMIANFGGSQSMLLIIVPTPWSVRISSSSACSTRPSMM